ncbi:MAG: branched-chain amino acid ABC transporter permease [Thermodesulfobacteriota bacterium]
MFLELVIRGTAIGLVYALMGVGLLLLHGIMRVINFAHGEFYMIGGYLAYYSITLLGLPFFLGIPVSMAATFVIGAVVEKLLLSPIHSKAIEKPMDYTLIMTFALLIFFRKVAALIFGPFYRKPPDYLPFEVTLFGVNLDGNLVLSGLVSGLLVIGLSLFIRKSWRGRSWRAITQSRNGARINGVNIRRESWIGCGTACALAAAAGALVAPMFLVSPHAGGPPLAKSYEVLAIGGLGSIAGSVVAGIVLGLSETLGAVYISSAYQDAIGFAIMALFLLFRPQGLFGQKV